MPVFTPLPISAKMRPEETSGEAGTAASLTRMPRWRNPMMAMPAGNGRPWSAWMRVYPVVSATALPGVEATKALALAA